MRETENHHRLLATGAYRIGLLMLVTGFAVAYLNTEAVNHPPEGWSMAVAGIVIAAHGAVAPVIEYMLPYLPVINRTAQ